MKYPIKKIKKSCVLLTNFDIMVSNLKPIFSQTDFDIMIFGFSSNKIQ